MTNPAEETTTITEQAVTEGGAYEVIRQRLSEQQHALETLTRKLNDKRLQEFGSTEMKVLGRMRLRTENNCLAKDLVLVGEHVLFGYNVHIGLRKEIRIEDVFALYTVSEHEGEYDLVAVSIAHSFLADQQFKRDFHELYSYYKDTELSQLIFKNNTLLASFQIGERLTDIRVFRWKVSSDGQTVEYIDNRGERDIQLPASHDFEWVACHRDDVVDGLNPHINILDTLFVDTSRGDLTIKVENNTNVGLGIYAEPVEEKNQALDDAEFYYADLHQIIVLKIKPYQEKHYRYLVFNRNTQKVHRIDAIGDACLQLPEAQGIIFPGGYYLTTGETKSFDDKLENLVYKRSLRSPNGEDVLYIFYHPESNAVILYGYNLIEKSLQNPIKGHGYGFYDDGRMIIFYANDEASRVHPLQIWKTPYYSETHASIQPASQSFLGKIGNAELVRGISELYSIYTSMRSKAVSANHYHRLSQSCQKLFDRYYWLDSSELTTFGKLLREISHTAELVIDEYEKVENIRAQSSKALLDAEAQQREIIRQVELGNRRSPQAFIDGLFRIRQHRGHLMTIQSYRYIDTAKIRQLDDAIAAVEDELNQQTVTFLASEGALTSYDKILDDVADQRLSCKTKAELQPHVDALQKLAESLDLISEMMATLKVEDATIQTRIVDAVSELYSRLNQQKAELEHQRQNMGNAEAAAQFSARLKLLSQSVQHALSMATTPEKCDEQFSRLLVQLEELEGEFGDFDDFIADVIKKREEVFEAFETHKQGLMDARQRKAQSLADAGERILQSVQRRVQRFSTQDELNAFYSADTLVRKITDIIEKLQAMDDSVKAEDLDAKLKATREQSVRALRDKSDLYEAGGQVIKLGPRHKFSVNTQALDLTILPKDDALFIRLTGTDYVEPLNQPELNALQDYWSMSSPAESDKVYRAEYLAYCMLMAAEQQEHLDMEQLAAATVDVQALTKQVATFAAPRYKEGYEKGIHDHDAALILQKIVPVYEAAGSLKYAPTARGLAAIYWANAQHGEQQKQWQQRAKNAAQMSSIFTDSQPKKLLSDEIAADMVQFTAHHQLADEPSLLRNASEYLCDELAQERVSFATTKYARYLCDEFITHLKTHNIWRDYQKSLDDMKGEVGKRWALAESCLQAFIQSQHKPQYANFIIEAIGILNAEQRIDRHDREIDVQITVEGLLGKHPKINNRSLTIQLDSFLDNNRTHHQHVIPNYEHYLQIRHQTIVEKRQELRLDEFKAKPLSSFVRNRLINEVYLPFIGDNLAKQIGSVGEKKRTDLMGLLLMISPPGYGKTTLMEYVADRLGLIFMKINCPAIGHTVTSIDPQQADNSTCRQELEKLNLALEMGNNVMLYLDDIQHTNSEFLQKFISLSDGTRRIEGVWKQQPKTYDMRGKKFCVVMAGNPYTESGKSFQIPDMLANRADIYNLGDVLSGKEDVFALSYIENALTSNPVLAPLASRDMQDVYKFLDMAKGGADLASSALSHPYSAAEIQEIVNVMRKMLVIQQVVWNVNQAYIAASAQDDKYRTEPTFKLQGSYRNMNKMAEKISAIMTDHELTRLVDDHYQGEAQLLTTGTEANLLKLAEIRNCMSKEQQQRWAQIKADFLRNKALGGDDADNGAKIVMQLNDLVAGMNAWRDSIETSRQAIYDEQRQASTADRDEYMKALTFIAKSLEKLLGHMHAALDAGAKRSDMLLSDKLADVLENTLQPLLKIMHGKLDLDLTTHRNMAEINRKLEAIDREINISS